MGINEIVTRTVNGEVSSRIVIHDNYIARTLFLGTDWSHLRIGVRLSIDATASMPATFAIGVCSGLNRPYGVTAANPVHFVGIQDTETTWTYSSGPPPRYNSIGLGIFKNVEGATSGGLITGSGRIVADVEGSRSVIMVDIIKGSPNFTLKVGFPSTSAGVGTDINDNTFSRLMETPIGILQNIVTGYGATTGHVIAVDEAADGFLDTANIYWDRTEGMEIIDFDVYRRTIV